MALMATFSLGVQPANSDKDGAAIWSKVTAADTGLPGRPKNKLLFNLPNASGLPGLIAIKFILLTLIILLAVDAKLRVLPKLSQQNLWDMALHIIAVTLLSIIFVIVGVSFKTGWLY